MCIRDRKLEIDSIINTHSHADHIGGNSIIQKRLNCDIYATKIEGAIIENPIIEPLYLFSSTPPNFLKNKFLMAKSSKVTKIIEEDFLDIEGTKFEIVHLPGHSLDHIGAVSYTHLPMEKLVTEGCILRSVERGAMLSG